MSTSLTSWAFALRQSLQRIVESQYSSEAHRWPLLRGFRAEGYRWRDTHLAIVLRDSVDQQTFVGSIKDLTEEPNGPKEVPSKASTTEWLNHLRERFNLRAQDAVVVIPALLHGAEPDKQFDRWNNADKELWRIQLAANLESQYEFLLNRSIAQREDLERFTKRAQHNARLTELTRLRTLLDNIAAAKKMTPQQRGKQFEAWLGDLFRLYDFNPTLDVVNVGEQIDFTFWKGDHFIVGEARWRTKNVNSPQVKDFFCKLLERPPYTLGLIISMANFTKPALDFLRKQSGQRTVLTMRGQDLRPILRGEPELPEWLSQTLRMRLEHPNK